MAPGPPSKWPTVSSRDESDLSSSPGLDERRRRRLLFRLLFFLLRWALRRFLDERSRRRRRGLRDDPRELVGDECDLERERERLFLFRDLLRSWRSRFGLRLVPRRLSTLLLL